MSINFIVTDKLCVNYNYKEDMHLIENINTNDVLSYFNKLNKQKVKPGIPPKRNRFYLHIVSYKQEIYCLCYIIEKTFFALGSVHIKSESKIKAREIVEIKIETSLS